MRVFFADSQSHRKAYASNAGWVFNELLGGCLGMVNGTRWKELRTRFEQAGLGSQRSTHTRIAGTVAEVKAFVGDKLTDATDRAQTVGTKGEFGRCLVINASSAVAAFPFFHTARLLYGSGALNMEDEKELWALGQTRAALMRFVLKGGLYRSGLSRFWDRAMYAEVGRFKRDWYLFNKRIYARGKRGKRDARNMLDGLWAYALESEEHMQEVIEALQDWKVGLVMIESYVYTDESKTLQTLDEILFANLDVTTHVLSWMIVLLAENRQTQQELRDEASNTRRGDLLAHYLSKKDSLLHWCLLETLRLRPVSGMSRTRRSQKANG